MRTYVLPIVYGFVCQFYSPPFWLPIVLFVFLRPTQTLSLWYTWLTRFLCGVLIITSNSWQCRARTIQIKVYGIFRSTWL